MQLLQPSLSKDPNKLGSFSAVSQIDFPSAFLLPRHLHLPKSRVCSVTGCETRHILGWQLQGRRARQEAQVSWGRHSYPMHLWYPAFSCPAWHLPALPGCRVATGLLHLPSASTEQRRSEQKETRFSHSWQSTHSIAAAWPTPVSNKGHSMLFMEDLPRWRLWRSLLPISEWNIEAGVGRHSQFLLKSLRKCFPRSTKFLLRLWPSFKAWKQPRPQHPKSFKRAVRHFQAGFLQWSF